MDDGFREESGRPIPEQGQGDAPTHNPAPVRGGAGPKEKYDGDPAPHIAR